MIVLPNSTGWRLLKSITPPFYHFFFLKMSWEGYEPNGGQVNKAKTNPEPPRMLVPCQIKY